ncbi:MAG: DNRLRE domain-containing protein [Saprospiraceae bacterium]|nr:DNRLRE domain-containing protein [Saprospiraceae bacterium]
MKVNPLYIFFLINALHINANAQALAQASPHREAGKSDLECFRTIFVQSPVSDTYVAKDRDTLCFGDHPTMKLRGLPAKKCMISYLSYEVHDLDAAYMSASYLKIYTVSKKEGHEIELSGVSTQVSEHNTTWQNQPTAHELIDRQSITNLPFVLFDVTQYVRGHLKNGFLDFHLKTNSKKTIDIASRESGLSAELIIEMCTPGQAIGEGDHLVEYNPEGWGIKVLPSDLAGKFTIQLARVPEGGFGDLIVMTERGDIVQQIPIAVQDADITYHTVDIGNLLPGQYWAVFRKGRAMVRDHFRLKPINGSTLLQVSLESNLEPEP